MKTIEELEKDAFERILFDVEASVRNSMMYGKNNFTTLKPSTGYQVRNRIDIQNELLKNGYKITHRRLEDRVSDVVEISW